MRQRVTYLLPYGTGVDPADIRIGGSNLQYAKVHEAAEERRITLGLSELPKELQIFLADFHELHIRISTRHRYKAFLPTVSRLPPGLHLFFTPRKPQENTKLCAGLHRILGGDVKCTTSSDSFSRPPILSERFASSSTYQFFQDPSYLDDFSQHLSTHFCSALSKASSHQSLCHAIAEGPTPSYVDVDFDVISHALNVVVFWNPPNTAAKSRRPAVAKLDPGDRLEVGILSPEKPDEPEELSLGGHLAVVGEDEKPNPTLFSFPARHHPLSQDDNSAFAIHFNKPAGLHPHLNITFPTQMPTPPKDSCALHAYFTLPSYLFIDRYQFSDRLFLASHNLVSLRALSGEQDLEAPDWAVSTWGSAALFEVNPSASGVTIPTHLRYINSTSGASLPIPWPALFWACEAEEGLKMATNPFDRVNLGYDGLFGPKTMFYHIPPESGEDMVEILTPPTLKGEWNDWIAAGTGIAVFIGFGWICWQLLRGLLGAQTGEREEKKKR